MSETACVPRGRFRGRRWRQRRVRIRSAWPARNPANQDQLVHGRRKSIAVGGHPISISRIETGRRKYCLLAENRHRSVSQRCTSDMPCRSPWRVVGQDRGDHKGLRYVPEKPDHNRGPGSELRMMDNAHHPRRYMGTKPIGEGFDTSLPVAKNRPAT